MLKRLFYSLPLIICSIVFGQSNFDVDQQQLYTYLYSKQYNKAKSIINSKFLTSIDQSRKVIGYVYLADYYGEIKNEEKKVEALEKAKNIALQTKKAIDLSYVKFGYSRYYYNLKQNELFIKKINEAIKEFSNYNNEDFILTQLYFLRYNYNSKNILDKDHQEDVVLANKHALMSKNPLLINFTYNNLGYYYKQKYKDTNDLKYLNLVKDTSSKAYHYANLIEDELAKNRSLIVYNLNMSSFVKSLEEKDSSEEILMYCNRALSIANKDSIFNDLKAFIYNNMGANFELKGNLDRAETYFQKAYDLIKDNSQLNQYKIIFLANLSNIAEKKGNLKDAINYLKEEKAIIIENDLYQFENNTKSLEIFYKTNQKIDRIKKLDEKNSLLKIQTVLYVCLSIIITFIFISIYFNIRFKRKLKTQQEIINHLNKKDHL